MYVLDTNVVSELRRPDRADPKVVTWASQQPIGTLYLSVVTILEIEQGAALLERRDAKQGDVIRQWINSNILGNFRNRILPIDLQVAQACARLHVPDPKSERDALIAATAIVHKMTVVTRNTSDFCRTGVELFNPWN